MSTSKEHSRKVNALFYVLRLLSFTGALRDNLDSLTIGNTLVAIRVPITTTNLRAILRTKCRGVGIFHGLIMATLFSAGGSNNQCEKRTNEPFHIRLFSTRKCMTFSANIHFV